MEIKVSSKTKKPKHQIRHAFLTQEKIKELMQELPSFLHDYRVFLGTSVALSTQLAYLQDIHFFFDYLIRETVLTDKEKIHELTIEDIQKLRARDLNEFLGVFCRRYYREEEGNLRVFENNNRTLSRKKSSLTSMFQFLFRNEQLPEDITPGLNPIKMPKLQPDAIKRLHEEELVELLDVVRSGKGLTEKELVYWEKTKLRDWAIIMLFVTYGLRLKEMVGLDVSSFNFNRQEFVIFRKRDKESIMPLNQSAERAVLEYLHDERPEFSTESALFLSLQGKRMTERAMRDMVKKYTSIVLGTTRSSGYSPHKLRATAASTLIERGFSIYDVQLLLDHDNVTTTQLYAAHRKHVKKDIVSSFELDEITEP